jgi:hypothetical protein
MCQKQLPLTPRTPQCIHQQGVDKNNLGESKSASSFKITLANFRSAFKRVLLQRVLTPSVSTTGKC